MRRTGYGLLILAPAAIAVGAWLVPAERLGPPLPHGSNGSDVTQPTATIAGPTR